MKMKNSISYNIIIIILFSKELYKLPWAQTHLSCPFIDRWPHVGRMNNRPYTSYDIAELAREPWAGIRQLFWPSCFDVREINLV